MKNKFTLFILSIGFGITGYAQVGISTDDPQATLDVNGNVKIRTTPEVTSLTSDHYILVKDQSTSGDDEISQISSSYFTAATAYAAESDGGWSLLNLGISGTNWNRLNLSSADTTIGDSTHFVNGTYTAPSSGVYVVNYELQLEAGVDITLLGNKRLGLIKNGVVIEDKVFDGVRVDLGPLNIATVPVTSTNINKMVILEAGDTLTFAVETGGINLGLLTDNKVSLYVYKVAN